MESEPLIFARDSAPCCSCGCSCSSDSCSSTGTWLRSVKRKLDEFESSSRFLGAELDCARVSEVQLENEIIALHKMVSDQQQTIQDLCADLEEERSASSSAANEAMSMILRLQREKAEIQMKASQFKRFSEEKMGYNQQELALLEDLLYKREQAIQSLTCEVQAYEHRMMSCRLMEAEADGEKSQRHTCNLSIIETFDEVEYEYPPPRRNLSENPDPLEIETDVADIDKHVFGETPDERVLKSLEHKRCEMERTPSSNQFDGDFPGTKNILEKVVDDQDGRHCQKFSVNSSSSFLDMGGGVGSELVKDCPRVNLSLKNADTVSKIDDCTKSGVLKNGSELGDDGVDRVCTIDSVHDGAPGVGICRDYINTASESLNQVESGYPDSQKLYVRLQALEADLVSMRQTIVSMQTDNTKLILLKEIALHLRPDIASERHIIVKGRSLAGRFSFMSIFVWIMSIFWQKKVHSSKYLFGLSPENVGLLLLLERRPLTRPQRSLTSSLLES